MDSETEIRTWNCRADFSSLQQDNKWKMMIAVKTAYQRFEFSIIHESCYVTQIDEILDGGTHNILE